MKIAIAAAAIAALSLIPSGAEAKAACVAPAGAVCAKPHVAPPTWGASSHRHAGMAAISVR